MAQQIPTALFPGKNKRPQETQPIVDTQRRPTDLMRRWMEFADEAIRHFSRLFTFLALEDTPDSYSGQAGKAATVKMDETGLEFTNPTGLPSGGTDGQVLTKQSATDFDADWEDPATGISPASTTEVLTGTDSTKYATPDAIAALWEQGSNVASAGTISLGEGGFFHITGTTTITDIDFATDKAGRMAWVVFDGILTLTHNASTLILPTGANITTAAGDRACIVSEGSDVVRCLAYTRASGSPLSGGVTGANPTATASDAAVNGSALTFMRSDGAPAIQKASALVFGIVKVDGSSITESGGVISAFGFAPSGTPFHPGYVTGQLYTSPAIVSLASTRAPTTNNLHAIPFYASQSITFSKISVFVTTGVVASTVRLGIYDNVGGLPTNLEFDGGSVATATNSALAELTGLSLVLTPGWHWLVVGTGASAPTLRATGTATNNFLWLTGVDASSPSGSNYPRGTWTPGSLPSTFPSIVYDAGNIPAVFLRN